MKKRTALILVVILLIIALILISITLLFKPPLRLLTNGHSLNSQPLVLIQAPLDQASMVVGVDEIIHATASSPLGVSEMELWVDDQLIASRQSPVSDPLQNMVLSASWSPSQPGEQNLIVRAISRTEGIGLFGLLKGLEGQASIRVTVEVSEDSGLTTHEIQEGETLESIAETYGITPDELEALNSGGESGTGDASLQPGEDIIVPGGSGGGEDPGIPSPGAGTETTDSALPAADAAPPGSFENLEIIWSMVAYQASSEPIQLTVEVLTLETPISYESLHCYISLATDSPRWLPDEDGNQATDESFASSNLGHTWGISQHMANDQALRLYWQEDQPIPIDLSCVGITNLGMEAVQLGRIVEKVEPDSWGLLQHAVSSGGEGVFQISYQVKYPGKGLDENITPPWNVRINEDDHRLSWDYLPNEGGRPAVDGFAILLNDSFQWIEPGSKRSAQLPDQWFRLPCGDEYRFQVVAFNGGYPHGSYSLPSNTAAIQGDEVGSPECSPSVVITFEQLTTGDLPGHPSPVYGSVFANDLTLAFDGRPMEDDNFPSSFGLERNSEYNISQVMHSFGDDQSQLIVELPSGNPSIHEYPLWVGFDIYKGGNKVCSGDNAFSEDELAGEIHETIETDLPAGSLPDWCQVSFTISPVGETPVVDPGSPPPLPDIVIENLTVDASSGNMRIHVRNVGQASWVQKDIVARLTWPGGEEIGVFSWTNMSLAPGQTAILSHGGMDHRPALGACVLLDPQNVVQEASDRLAEQGIISKKAPYCRPLPDLSISNIAWDPGSSQLNITLQNQGERSISSTDSDGSLDHADLPIWINLPEGRPLTRVFNDLNMSARESQILSWPLGEIERQRLSSGYNIEINPEESIAELDFSNNTFTVEGSSRLRLVWGVAYATFCPTNTVTIYGENVSGKNTWDFQLDAMVGNGSSRRIVADWNTPEIEIPWTEPSGDPWCAGGDPFMTDWFEVAGDETLTVSLKADLDISGHGFRWFSGGSDALTAVDDFGGTTHVPGNVQEECFLDGMPVFADVGPNISSNGIACGFDACNQLSDDGVHQRGIMEARSDDITGYCWWSTTYKIYRMEEP